MIRYIVRHPPFYPQIFFGVSPSVGSAGHLPGLHLSGPHLGGPPVRLAGGHLTSSVHRCPEGHAVMNGPVAGGHHGGYFLQPVESRDWSVQSLESWDRCVR